MPTDPLAALLRLDLAGLGSYEPLPGTFPVRLDANESPPLLSPEAASALARALIPAQWNRYPDARAVELRQAIAERCDADPDEVLVGAGSDEVIALLLQALDRPRCSAERPAILTPSPTFVMYRTSALVRGFSVVEVPLDQDWDLDVEAMRRAIEAARPNVVFVATPNNPTGNLVSEDRLRAVIEAAADSLVVIDEAYVDFAPRSQIALRRAYPNVGVLRTLSKVGFASLRVGWFIGPRALVREVDKARQPFNLPGPSQLGATFVLRQLGGEVERMRAALIAERHRLAAELGACGWVVSVSDANFLWVKAPGPAREIQRALADRGVLVKSFAASGERLSHQLRITVGLPAENDRLLREIGACS
jgi:histidinol-phosphate aminotransferase